MNNLFFFDVDGTLVDHGKGISSISQNLKDALKILKNKGDKYFICTGRSFGALPEEIKEMNPDGYSLSAGAFVIMNDKVLRNVYFAKEDLNGILDELEKVSPLILLECGFSLLSNKSDTEGYEELINVFKIDIDNIGVYHRNEELLVNKISVTLNKEEDSWVLNKIKDYGATVLPQPVPLSYDITITGMTKKDGLMAIKNNVEKGAEYKTIAIGDSHNDIEMIEFADIGIAMGNAVEEVKEVADYTTKSVEDDGVYKALKSLGLLN